MSGVLLLVIMVLIDCIILVKMLLGDVESYVFCGTGFLLIAGFSISLSKKVVETENILIGNGALTHVCKKIMA